MFLFIRRLWSSIAGPRMLLGNRRKRQALRGVVATRILSLAAILVAIMLRCGCHSDKNPTPDVLLDPPLQVAVSESPVQQLPSLPSVDQENGQPVPCSPYLALGPPNSCSSDQRYVPLIPDENRDWFRVEKVQGQASDPRFLQPDFPFSDPLWQNDRNEWTTSGKVHDTLFPPNAIFTDRQQPSPDDLWNVEFSTTYRHIFENGWIDGVSVTIESVSKKPFNSLSQMTEEVKAFLKVPQGQHDFWLCSLSYSSSKEWSLPIPKVEYSWQPSGRLQANIGLILPITDHPLDDLSLGVSVKLLSPVEP